MTNLGGGGGDVGGARFSISVDSAQAEADLDRFSKKVQELTRTFEATSRAGESIEFLGTPAEFERIASVINKAETSIKNLSKAFGRFPNESEKVNKAMESIAGEALALAKGLGLTDEQLKQIEQRFASAAVGATREAGKLSGAFNKIAQSGGRFSGVAGAIGGVLGKAETKLASFGLSVSDVSILLGAGFAGGVAGAVQVGLQLIQMFQRAAEAAIKFGIEVSKLAIETNTFRDRLRAGFGEGAQIIEEFAEGSARDMGLAERAAFSLTGTIANLFKSFGESNEASAQFAVDLAQAARVIQQTSFTTDTYEEVLTGLKGALTGNVEALREYGIAVNERTLKEVAAANGIRLVSGEMDAAMKALLAYIFIQEQAAERQDEFSRSGEDQLTVQQRLASETEHLKVAIGEELAPAFLAATEFATDLVKTVGEGIKGFSDWLDEHEHLTDAAVFLVKAGLKPTEFLLKTISKAVEIAANNYEFLADKVERLLEILPGDNEKSKQEEFNEAFGDFGKDINVTGKELEQFSAKFNKYFKLLESGEITGQELFDILSTLTELSPEQFQEQMRANFESLVAVMPELEKYRDELFRVDLGHEAAVESARKLAEEQRRTPEHLKKTIEAYEDYADAIEEAKKSEKEAEEALEDAKVDGAKKVAKAQRDVVKAQEDAARRIDDARRGLADAERKRDEDIADAREKLRDTEEEQTERIHDAEDKLRETRIDSAKKIQDAERALHEARLKQRQEITDAQISVEQALHRGDAEAFNRAQIELARARQGQDIRQAEIALQEARADAIENLKEAEEDLTEAREEGAEKVARAQRELVKTIEESNRRVDEAQRKLDEAIEEGAERVAEARERLADTEEDVADRIKEAEERLIEVRERNIELIEDAKNKVLEMEGAFEESVDDVVKLNIELDKLRQKLGLTEFSTFFGDVPGSGYRNREHGGSVFAKNPYVVGERGPELFIPDSSGTVVSNSDLADLIALMKKNFQMGGVSGLPPIYITETVDPIATIDALIARLGMGLDT